MVCINCSKKMICNQTKNYHDETQNFNYVERRRVCLSCGYRLMTVEIPQELFTRNGSHESSE
jgi:transcriptional regulator NrdR family protein